MITFTVYGTPQPQGSARAFLPKGHTRPIITSDNAKNKPWRQQVALTAMAEKDKANWAPILRPCGVRVVVHCFFAPPAKMPKGRTEPSTRPDADKLLRSFLDALTGVLYEDDAQVVYAHICKSYGVPERAELTITRWPEEPAQGAF